MRIPRWILHAGIVLNTVMFVGFYVAGMLDMVVLSFLSACSFWVGLILRDRIERNE